MLDAERAFQQLGPTKLRGHCASGASALFSVFCFALFLISCVVLLEIVPVIDVCLNRSNCVYADDFMYPSFMQRRKSIVSPFSIEYIAQKDPHNCRIYGGNFVRLCDETIVHVRPSNSIAIDRFFLLNGKGLPEESGSERHAIDPADDCVHRHNLLRQELYWTPPSLR